MRDEAMDEIEIRSFAAAVMIVAAGHEVQRAVPLADGGAAFYFSGEARAVAALFQQVKSKLRAIEAQARRRA
jgi:hypothetical protein